MEKDDKQQQQLQQNKKLSSPLDETLCDFVFRYGFTQTIINEKKLVETQINGITSEYRCTALEVGSWGHTRIIEKVISAG